MPLPLLEARVTCAISACPTVTQGWTASVIARARAVLATNRTRATKGTSHRRPRSPQAAWSRSDLKLLRRLRRRRPLRRRRQLRRQLRRRRLRRRQLRRRQLRAAATTGGGNYGGSSTGDTFGSWGPSSSDEPELLGGGPASSVKYDSPTSKVFLGSKEEDLRFRREEVSAPLAHRPDGQRAPIQGVGDGL